MKNKTALVLSGGGVLGAFQVGVMKEIFKKITPDIVIGTSIGSINAAFAVNGEDLEENVKKLEQYWKENSIVINYNMNLFLRGIYSESIYSLSSIEYFLKSELKNDFKSSSKEIYINCTSLKTGENVFFNSGNLIDCVLASISVPITFPPKKIKNELYIDGGAGLFTGIKFAEQIGCRKIIFINLINKIEEMPENILEKGVYFAILEAIQKIELEKSLLKKETKLIEIKINKKYNYLLKSLRDFSHTSELLKHGEETAKTTLKNLGI